MTDEGQPAPAMRRPRRRLGPRASDLLNLCLLLGAAVLLLARVIAAQAGVWERGVAAGLSALALYGAWQMARRRFFPGLQPKPWEGSRLARLRAVHGTVLVVGSALFLGYAVVFMVAPQRLSRAMGWLVVVGYFVVIATISDFLKDREPQRPV